MIEIIAAGATITSVAARFAWYLWVRRESRAIATERRLRQAHRQAWDRDLDSRTRIKAFGIIHEPGERL